MAKDTIHKIFNDDGDTLYLCVICNEYLEYDNFHNEKRLKHRDFRSYRCKECVRDINRNNREPAEDERVMLKFIFDKLGYDTTDLVNNPIHVQFDERFKVWRDGLEIQEQPQIKERKAWNKYVKGVKIKDMTPEERKEYNHQAYKRYRERYYYYVRRKE